MAFLPLRRASIAGIDMAREIFSAEARWGAMGGPLSPGRVTIPAASP